MPRRLLTLSCILIAGCGQSPENVVAVMEVQQQPIAAAEPYDWPECIPPGVNSFGNKWWGSFSVCKGDVRVVVDGYSAHLMAAGLHYEVDTRNCPTGASYDNVEDDAFFEKPIDEQQKDIRARVTLLLRRLGESCRAPIDVETFLDAEFDRKFRDLADSYWLHVPKEKIREGRIRNRGERSSPE